MLSDSILTMNNIRILILKFHVKILSRFLSESGPNFHLNLKNRFSLNNFKFSMKNWKIFDLYLTDINLNIELHNCTQKTFKTPPWIDVFCRFVTLGWLRRFHSTTQQSIGDKKGKLAHLSSAMSTTCEEEPRILAFHDKNTHTRHIALSRALFKFKIPAVIFLFV